MEKVTVYKLSNGELIEDMNSAILREKEINFNIAIKNLIGSCYCSEDSETIEGFISDNRFELKSIFAELL